MTRSDSRKALGKGLHSLLPHRGEKAAAGEAAAPSPEVPGERILKVPIGHVQPNPNQPRSEFDENALADLAHSIGRDGILQPIVARRTAAERFEIIAGERRWRAAQQAGLSHVPLILHDADEHRSLELALVENIQREDLNPIELAHAFNRMAELGMSHEEIGSKTGKDRATISNSLRLLQLTEEVQGMLASRRLSAGHARALLKVEDAEAQIELARRIIGEGWSVRQVEDFTRPLVVGRPGRPDAEAGPASRRQSDPNVRAAEEELQEALGTKVRIIPKGRGKGQIEIEYYSDEDLQRLYELIAARQN